MQDLLAVRRTAEEEFWIDLYSLCLGELDVLGKLSWLKYLPDLLLSRYHITPMLRTLESVGPELVLNPGSECLLKAASTKGVLAGFKTHSLLRIQRL